MIEQIEAGNWRIAGPGMKANKPVVVDSAGKWVKGSGRPAKANDPVAVGKATGYRKSKSYNEFLEELIPARKEDSANAIADLQEITQAAVDLAIGALTKLEAKCPECEHEFDIEYRSKPDQKMVQWLMARLTGDAAKAVDVNVRSEQIVALIQDYRPGSLEPVGLTAEEMERRRSMIVDGNIVE